MKFIGIDPSFTGTGIIALNEECEIVDEKLISTKSKDLTEKRMSQILEEIKKIITGKDDILYIEGLSFGSKGQAMLELAGLHYIITMMLYTNNIQFKKIPPGTLKKFITGKGNAKKNLMLLKVYKKFGIEFMDDNIADAYSLARLAFEEYKEGK